MVGHALLEGSGPSPSARGLALIKKDGFPLSKKGLPTKFPALLSKWEVCY